jgi:hypothetical protein
MGKGGGGCNSFTAITNVLMADGTRKAIISVAIGDSVLATDPVTKTAKAEPVTDTIVTTNDTAFTDLTVHTAAGNQVISSTQHHPYWDDTRKQWVNAGDLKTGEKLQRLGGAQLTFVGLRNYTSHIVTYNLTVAQIHTYYVLAGTTPVLVHNCAQAGGDASSAARSRGQDLAKDDSATGDHTVFERDADGKVTRYQTYKVNDRAPSGWQQGPRFSGTGRSHSGMNPPLYYPKGGGRALMGFEVPENIPPGYELAMIEQAGL